MKKPQIVRAFCALALLYIFCGITFAQRMNQVPEPLYDSPEYAEELYAESGGPVDGMYFSTEYVVECYEYDDAYAIVYDDPDANIVECEILVSAITYAQIMRAQANDMSMRGNLYLLSDGQTWGFVWDGCME